MTERIWISRVAIEIVFQPLYSDTGAPLHEELVTTVRKKPTLHLELYQRDVTGGMRTLDRVLLQPARDTTCAFLARDQGPHQRGIAHEDAEGCHTDQRCAPREGARGERDLRFSARDQTSVTSLMRHTRLPGSQGACRRQVHEACRFHQEAGGRTDTGSTGARQSGAAHLEGVVPCALSAETQPDSQIVSIHVHSTAPPPPCRVFIKREIC